MDSRVVFHSVSTHSKRPEDNANLIPIVHVLRETEGDRDRTGFDFFRSLLVDIWSYFIHRRFWGSPLSGADNGSRNIHNAPITLSLGNLETKLHGRDQDALEGISGLLPERNDLILRFFVVVFLDFFRLFSVYIIFDDFSSCDVACPSEGD